MSSSFSFLQTDYPELFALSELAERLIEIDPSSSLTKSRLLSEKVVSLIWEFEELEKNEEPHVKKIDILFREKHVPEIIKNILHTIRRAGNRGTHKGESVEAEAVFIVKKSFRLLMWFYETYENKSLGELSYSLPPKAGKDEMDMLSRQVEQLSREVTDYQQKIQLLNQSQAVRDKRKKQSEQIAGKIRLNEQETRIMLIDPQLRKAGWECDSMELNYQKNKTVPCKGRNMAIAEWNCGSIRADYALFVGTTLYGIVEAKKFATDISTNLHQSKIYAAHVMPREGVQILGDWHGHKAPFLFSTNGREYLEQIKTKSGIWFLDVRDPHNHSRALRAWYSPEGLVALYERDVQELNEKLRHRPFDFLQDKAGLNLRYYQIDAIRAIEDKIMHQPEDKRALLVMATGTGKTRTAIGLAYRLISTDRFRRILFITDRRLLTKQAYDDFNDKKVENLLPFARIYDMEGADVVQPDPNTRLHFATVQGMVKRLFYAEKEKGEPLKMPADLYDCIIVDEAHRGYNLDREMDEEDLSFRNQNDYVSQYKRVIDYFDAHVIGLTATPALHTTQIFGMPVHSYSYREAVIDGFLIDHEPPHLIVTKLSQEGILWEKGEKPTCYNPETNSIEELAELEDELHIEVEQFNKQVITENFNRTVIRKLVEYLDPESDAKTLIFAARDNHADMIVQMLYEEFTQIGVEPHQDAIKKITGNVYDPEMLTKLFKNEKYPSIAVTVDLLSTGIDVPQISNLVFLRRTNSRIGFEQMLGRATRRCDEIGKESFHIFDAVRVYEAFKDFTQMQTVSPSFSFTELMDEMEHIESDERKRRQIELIVSKLQRKCRKMSDDQREHFSRLSEGYDPATFMQTLREMPTDDLKDFVQKHRDLWDYLDTRIYRQPKPMLYSLHEDELLYVSRGYGNAEKPEDYIDSFKAFIEENRNAIMALQMVCNRPNELTRATLKELKLILDEKGYSETKLNTAWKTAKNEDIAADIIAYIRTLALDTSLVTPEQRVKNAIRKVRELHAWNAVQTRWIERFEGQLLAETILTKEDLDRPPFTEEGGYTRLNKIFNNELDTVLKIINDNLFIA